jgi:hypothetical protein
MLAKRNAKYKNDKLKSFKHFNSLYLFIFEQYCVHFFQTKKNLLHILQQVFLPKLNYALNVEMLLNVLCYNFTIEQVNNSVCIVSIVW